MSVMDDVTKAVTMDFKRPGNMIGIVGLTKDEMGGSHYWDIDGYIGNSVPTVDVRTARETMIALHSAMDDELILSCHDCSEGGIGVALAEMAFAGEVGAVANLDKVPHEPDMREDHILFSESNSRFIIEVEEEKTEMVSGILKNVPFAWIGETTDSDRLIINGAEGTIVDEDIFELKAVWQAPLKTV